jgi:D-alanyl-D-alanine carboxypeptidase
MPSGLFEVYQAPQLDQMKITPHTKVDPRALVTLAVKNPPDFPPGQGWHYSNTGSLLLGLIIEAVTHQPIQSTTQPPTICPVQMLR